MKKRICSLFLVAGCLASTLLLPSCTKPTAHQLLSDAMEKTAALDQFSADLDIEVQMGAVGLNMKVPMSYQIAAAGLQGDTPVASGTLEMDLFGLQSVTQLYQEGDSIYYTAGLLKGKTARRDAPGSYDLLAEVQRLVQPLPEELLEELEMVEEDGLRTLSLSLEDETFSEVYSDLIKDMTAVASKGETVGDISASEGTVTIGIDAEGYLASYDVTFKLTMMVATVGMAMKSEADVSLSLRYNDPGKEVTVTPPEGYESFPDLPLSLFR